MSEKRMPMTAADFGEWQPEWQHVELTKHVHAAVHTALQEREWLIQILELATSFRLPGGRWVQPAVGVGDKDKWTLVCPSMGQETFHPTAIAALEAAGCSTKEDDDVANDIIEAPEFVPGDD